MDLVRFDRLDYAIGVLRQAYERDTTDPEVVSVFTKALADMKTSGAVIVDPVAVDLSQVRRAQGAATCGGRPPVCCSSHSPVHCQSVSPKLTPLYCFATTGGLPTG